MTKEESRLLAWRIYRKLKSIGCVIGNASVPFIAREIVEFSKTTECPYCQEETPDTGGDELTCEECGCDFRFTEDGPTVVKEPSDARGHSG